MQTTQYNFIDYIASDCLEHLADKDKKRFGLLSGFSLIDRATGGFHGGDVITISGRPGVGKTAFAMSMASRIAMNSNTPVMFFSLKFSTEQLVLRFLSSFSEIPLPYLLDCSMPVEKWKELEKARENISKMYLIINETPIEDFNTICTVARMAVRESFIRAIFIDALHYIPVKYRQNRNRNDEIAELMFKIKALAIELDLPIIITSLLNRTDGFDELSIIEPQLHELRDSGVIEEVSDSVMFIHRPECYHIFQDDQGHDMRGLAEIHICKSILGYTRKVTLEYKSNCAKFVPCSYSYLPYPKENQKSEDEPFP